MKATNKICFVMQRHAPGTHMDYVYEMARTLKEERGLPLTLLLEKGVRSTAPDWVITQRFKWAPLRVLENFWLLLTLHLKGHRTFYVHYSFVSAISAGLITKVFGGTVYYWNAGMPWLYHRPWYIEWYQKLAYRMIDVLVTGADELHDGYQRTYGLKPEQIIIIPNWIDLAEVKPAPEARASIRQALGITDDAPIVLFIHKLAKRKGADHLIPTFEALKGKYHFVIAGDGPLLSELQTYQTQSDHAKHWHVLGRVDRDRVHELLQAVDVFFMPSEEEGSPHSLIEAMAYGVPFVSSKVGGVPSTVPPELRTSLSQYGDISGYASQIEELLTNPTAATKAKRVMAEWMPRFDKPQAIKSFKNLLLEK